MKQADGSGPRGRADVRIVRVGDEGVLYDPVAVRAHRVNVTGLVVWECCDGTASIAEISAELAEAFGEAVDEVADSVREVAGRFASAGLLDGIAGVPRRPSDPPGLIGSDGSLPVAAPLRRLGPYSALDLRVSIDCHDSHAVADEIERALGSFAAAPPDTPETPATDEVTITVWSDGDGGWNLDTDGSRLHADDESVVADYVLWQITHLAIDRSSRYLIVHASAVARDGVAVVFPADADSGKSTLATILVEAGFDYLTDEATAIDLDTGQVIAYPKPITLDPGSQQLLAHLDPGGLAGSSQRWRIAPTDIRSGAVAERATLTHLVFPTHVPGGDNTLVPVDTIDAVVGLVSGAFNLAEHGDRLDDLVRLAERCTKHSLRHDGVDGPIAAVSSLY